MKLVRTRLTSVAIAALVLGLSGPAAAQSDLVELAKREKERRAKLAAKGKETKSYSEEDARAAGGTLTLTQPLTPVPEAVGAPVVPPEVQAEQAKAAWQKRLGDARAAIETAKSALAAREAEYQKAFSDIAPQAGTEPDRLQKREARLAELKTSIAAAKKALADAQQKLAIVEEEARRARVPAGWLR